MRCSNLIKLRRGFRGTEGKPGPPGRDGLGGLPGRDGGVGRDGRDCPCQNRDLSEFIGGNYGAAFAGRTKRTVDPISYKNVTVTRFGRDDCPKIKGMVVSGTGMYTIIDSSTLQQRTRLEIVPVTVSF